jgi:isochorismate hydrolase
MPPQARARVPVAVVAFLAACAAAAPPRAEAQPPPAPLVQPQPEPEREPVQAAPALPPANEEEQQVLALIADLQRYSSETSEELRRDLAAANQAINRARTDINRVRLAVLLTLPGAGPPDDARAMGLLEAMVGKSAGASPIRQLASVLYAQIVERVRGLSEEKKKSAAAQEKLDQLRAVERSLLLERNRNAGGGAGGGGGGGGTGR